MSRKYGPTPWTINADRFMSAQPAQHAHTIVAVPWTPANALLATALEPLGYQVASFRPGHKHKHQPAARITDVRISIPTGALLIEQIDHNTEMPNVAASSIRANVRLDIPTQPTSNFFIAPQFLIDRHGNIAYTLADPPHADAPSSLASSFAIHEHFFFENSDNYGQMLEAWLAILNAKARNAVEANLLPPHQLADNHALRLEQILPTPRSQPAAQQRATPNVSTP